MRDYRFDNIKACLIILVVLGHFLEIVPGHPFLYLFIYSFHMPVFVFISGYFAKFDRKKLFFDLLCPYFIFQTVYLCFDAWIIKSKEVELIYTKPWWLTWYLLAMVAYHLLIPLIDVKSRRNKGLILMGTIVLALLSGYDKSVGYTMSLARILSFLPFFVAGYYMHKDSLGQQILQAKRKNLWITCSYTIMVVLFTAYVLHTGLISKKMLYGSYSYEAADYSMGIKALLLLIASAWIILFLWVTPNKKIALLSNIGRYTMPIFLLHGFLVKLAGKWIAQGKLEMNLLQAILATLVIVIILGNKYSNALFTDIFTLKWVRNAISKPTTKNSAIAHE